MIFGSLSANEKPISFSIAVNGLTCAIGYWLVIQSPRGVGRKLGLTASRFSTHPRIQRERALDYTSYRRWTTSRDAGPPGRKEIRLSKWQKVDCP